MGALAEEFEICREEALEEGMQKGMEEGMEKEMERVLDNCASYAVDAIRSTGISLETVVDSFHLPSDYREPLLGRINEILSEPTKE